ncbi:MAG: hypothetical protein J1E81_06050 [Eubacterium sp.]|nr:hypothetical protein [Eubacterium sp.]
MKPLTIEELKALPVGDWVWIKHGEVESYFRKDVLADDQFATPRFMYSDYGTKWLAYKNKEFAESKGEIVELPCALGQKLYAIENDSINEYYASEINVHEDGRFIFETPKLFPHRLIFGEDIFVDKDQAQQKLLKLKGDN